MSSFCLKCEPLEDRSVPANLPTGFSESLIAAGLDLPTSMTVAPDGRLFVTEKGGGIRIVKDGQLLPTPFARLTVETEFERGLQSLAFDPNFEANHRIYVYYTLPEADGVVRNRVAVYTESGDVAADGPTPLVTLDRTTGPAHNGGALAFGPDGMLYVSTGDASLPSNSQNLNNRLGKLLRYNPDGTIPADNPTTFGGLSGTTTGDNRAIWAVGLRNPFTMSFQPGTGRLFINDVGGNEFEEINVGQVGANYGWPVAEGHPDASGAIAGLTYPIYSYPNLGRAAIAGAAFYNPPVTAFPPAFVGDYFFADYVTGEIFVRDGGTGRVDSFATGANGLVNLTALPDGRLAYLLITNGNSAGGPSGLVRAIRFGTGNVPPAIAAPPADLLVSDDDAAVFTAEFGGSAPLSFQWQRDSGAGFEDVPGATGPAYTLFNAQLPDSGSRFRVVVTNPFGSATSSPATLSVTDSERPVISIDLPTPDFLFRGGQPVPFAFTAVDPETGPLPVGSYTYQVEYVTGSALPRPFLPPTVGRSGSFTAADVTPYLRTDVAYRITVTARDDVGLTASAVRDVFPRVQVFSLAANFAGIPLDLDGGAVVAGHVEPSVVGLQREVVAAETVIANGRTFQFIGWSDGGPRERVVVVPDTPATFTAVYELVSAQIGSAAPQVVAAAAGRAVAVRNGVESFAAIPFGAGFAGEVRVATGDVTGDGIADVVTAAGPGGGPHVKVFDGATGAEVGSFFAYDAEFAGGVFVAVGDVTGDGVGEIILAAGPGGGPHVKAIRFADMAEVLSFYAYDPTFTGGARVAAGDVTGDGIADLITTAGPGGGPHVKAFDGATGAEVVSFFAYDPAFAGGVWISAADLDGDGRAEVLTGAGPGGGPGVKAFSADGTELSSAFAFEESFTGGVRVGAGDANADGTPDVVAGAGPGGGPVVRVFDGKTGELLNSVLVGPVENLDGVYVG